MIRLPPGSMTRSACWATRKLPMTLTAITCWNSSSGYSVTGATTPNTPALANAQSSRPNRSTVAATAAATSSERVTSQARQASASPFTPAAARSSSSGSRSAMSTRAPAATNARAVARPMLPAPPVISATFPASRDCGCALKAPPFCGVSGQHMPGGGLGPGARRNEGAGALPGPGASPSVRGGRDGDRSRVVLRADGAHDHDDQPGEDDGGEHGVDGDGGDHFRLLVLSC